MCTYSQMSGKFVKEIWSIFGGSHPDAELFAAGPSERREFAMRYFWSAVSAICGNFNAMSPPSTPVRRPEKTILRKRLVTASPTVFEI
ncbi:hypothetical protein L596_012504 [Steinernema carpocapsae]|uniref:Uncharacterized protein n=1 Tax=Steinernema carpocapsae TaxID=34508 RepID=A0A4U5NY69_STECR|nr:hypothetical protein L596_012504 [Steinernema carpocapsae]